MTIAKADLNKAGLEELVKSLEGVKITLSPKQKQKRGFASMDPQRQREIASMGGKQAHRNGTAYEFTSEVAKKAGKLSHKNRRVKSV